MICQGIQEHKTKRVKVLILKADTFEEERILESLGKIIGSGDYFVEMTRGDTRLLAFEGEVLEKAPSGGDDDGI